MSEKHDNLIQTVNSGKLPQIPKTTANNGTSEVKRTIADGLERTTFGKKTVTAGKKKK